MSTCVDPALIARLRDGEEAAFRAIYDQLHGRIYRLILALLKDTAKTEEVLQETFISLWMNRHKLDGEQPLYPYIYLIAKRLAIDHFRKKLAETNASDYVKVFAANSTNNTEETVFFEDLNRFARESINSLPAQQQQVFTLSRDEGLSYDEIAERLQISPNTVRNHMVNALRTLKLRFTQQGMIYW
ncbi:RNA polymerase sigma-70 factor [Parapedobacter sp. ISTM3]|uniref:RNA polymerase sigma-70 factor, ECF subfamily n=1 Tax=Parapedobacter luteus TaxID=623280 RepID=A0A1T5CY62_9SPHI|nr:MULTISPECIES: RNA polymerase sigma-70 factor [Parapedobacter]MBK1440631.1 RNA polymerase sigma-70 factor [Parapedobacter sp. ISTM3]SKB64297.1 RNA polymerase sigma-70 factor, ECF subfamily [Parapedobacter luteus]